MLAYRAGPSFSSERVIHALKFELSARLSVIRVINRTLERPICKHILEATYPNLQGLWYANCPIAGSGFGLVSISVLIRLGITVLRSLL